MRSAARRCSAKATLPGPSVRMTANGSDTGGGAAACSVRVSRSPVAGCTGRGTGFTTGRSRVSVSRAAEAYSNPEGVRALSSSTRKVPSGARTMSYPTIAAGVVPPGRRPTRSGSNPTACSTTSLGIGA